MCKLKFTNIRMPASVCLPALLGLATSLLPLNTHAAVSCNKGLGASINTDLTTAHINDIVTVTFVKISTSSGDCAITNVNGWIVLPDNTFRKVVASGSQGFPLGPACASCGADADPNCISSFCLPISFSYQIKPTDLNNPLSFTTP